MLCDPSCESLAQQAQLRVIALQHNIPHIRKNCIFSFLLWSSQVALLEKVGIYRVMVSNHSRVPAGIDVVELEILGNYNLSSLHVPTKYLPQHFYPTLFPSFPKEIVSHGQQPVENPWIVKVKLHKSLLNGISHL